MADIVDRAQHEQDRNLAEALRKQAERGGIGDPADWECLSAKWCKGCAERILDERRKAIPGVQHCVECAELIEKKEKRKGW